jgi:hypothetical protein
LDDIFDFTYSVHLSGSYNNDNRLSSSLGRGKRRNPNLLLSLSLITVEGQPISRSEVEGIGKSEIAGPVRETSA